MRKLLTAFTLALFASAYAAQVFAQAAAQTAPAPANNVLGDVLTVDAASKQIYLKTDAGAVVIVVEYPAGLRPNAQHRKVPPAYQDGVYRARGPAASQNRRVERIVAHRRGEQPALAINDGGAHAEGSEIEANDCGHSSLTASHRMPVHLPS